MIKRLTKLYEIINYIWLIILFFSVIATYACGYNIEPLNFILNPFHGLNVYNIDITFWMVLSGILFIFINLRFEIVSFKDFFEIFLPNMFFLLYIVWYLYGV